MGNRDYLLKARHHVYRHFDIECTALYVGCAVDVDARFKTQRRDETWWTNRVAKTIITVHPTRDEARYVERSEIVRLHPLHNAQTYWMETERWAASDYLAHAQALAEGTYNETVHPRSGLGRLAAGYAKKYGGDLLDELGEVTPGYRARFPDEPLPTRKLTVGILGGKA